MRDKLDIQGPIRWDGTVEQVPDQIGWFRHVANQNQWLNDAAFRLEGYEDLTESDTAIAADRRVTNVTITGEDNVVMTLANGMEVGQKKMIRLESKGSGDLSVEVASLADGDEILFTEAPVWVELLWNGTAWQMLNQEIDARYVGGLTAAEILAAVAAVEHTDLVGLQGGDADDQFHLTEAQHDGLTDGGNTTLHDHLLSTDAGLTASITQSQGEGPLTARLNEVATVANIGDTVTLPTAVAGLTCIVINNGANALRIFPASGDDLGAGVDTARTVDLAAGSNLTFVAYDATNWEEI